MTHSPRALVDVVNRFHLHLFTCDDPALAAVARYPRECSSMWQPVQFSRNRALDSCRDVCGDSKDVCKRESHYCFGDHRIFWKGSIQLHNDNPDLSICNKAAFLTDLATIPAYVLDCPFKVGLTPRHPGVPVENWPAAEHMSWGETLKFECIDAPFGSISDLFEHEECFQFCVYLVATKFKKTRGALRGSCQGKENDISYEALKVLDSLESSDYPGFHQAVARFSYQDLVVPMALFLDDDVMECHVLRLFVPADMKRADKVMKGTKLVSKIPKAIGSSEFDAYAKEYFTGYVSTVVGGDALSIVVRSPMSEMKGLSSFLSFFDTAETIHEIFPIEEEVIGDYLDFDTKLDGDVFTDHDFSWLPENKRLNFVIYALDKSDKNNVLMNNDVLVLSVSRSDHKVLLVRVKRWRVLIKEVCERMVSESALWQMDLYRKDAWEKFSSFAFTYESLPNEEKEKCHPMTHDEIKRLSVNIDKLPNDKLGGAVQIMRSREASLRNAKKEMEVDLEKLKPSTLRELQRFVASSQNKGTADGKEVPSGNSSESWVVAENTARKSFFDRILDDDELGLDDDDDDGGHFECHCKSESPKKRKKLTQKEIGKIVKKAKDKKEGKREVPVKRATWNATGGEVSVGVSSHGYSVIGLPGMKLQEEGGNLRLQLPGFEDVVLATPDCNERKTKESSSGAKSKNGPKEEAVAPDRNEIAEPSEDDAGKSPEAENGAARDSPSSDSSAASKECDGDDTAFDQDRYMAVLQSVKTILKSPDKSNKVKIGKWQCDLLKAIKGKIEDSIDNAADELSTCSHCAKVDFDMSLCGGCRTAWFCDAKACRKNFVIKHRKSAQCQTIVADRFSSHMDKCLKEYIK